MFHISSSKCTKCGSCVTVCPQQAITINDDLAVVNQELCIQCGICAEVCRVGAIREVAPAQIKLAKGGENMPYGYGRGFGFGGTSPSWPYIGRGRGGLPRCWYPGPLVGATPYMMPLAAANWPASTGEGELAFLKDQADIMKSQLEDIERRIQEIEKTE